MTDKINDKIQSMDMELLSASDELLLQAFFADNMMAEIPDDGFSDRVMLALPALEQKKTLLTLEKKTLLTLEQEKALTKRRRLEHLWTAVCVAIGMIAAVVCQGWEQIQGWLFSMKLEFLMTGSRALTHVAESIGHSQNLLMMLAGIFVLIMVWGYNELADARG